jgi:excisionase family DNA binding protein
MSTQTQDKPGRVSLRVAAAHVDVHPDTLRRRIAERKLAAYRMGPKLIRVDLADVEALFTSA